MKQNCAQEAPPSVTNIKPINHDLFKYVKLKKALLGPKLLWTSVPRDVHSRIHSLSPCMVNVLHCWWGTSLIKVLFIIMTYFFYKWSWTLEHNLCPWILPVAENAKGTRMLSLIVHPFNLPFHSLCLFLTISSTPCSLRRISSLVILSFQYIPVSSLVHWLSGLDLGILSFIMYCPWFASIH